MPQLVKGGKWVFGWSIVGPNGELQIPPEAYNEYSFRPGESMIITRGSRTSGGFGLGRPERLSNSPLQSRFIGHVRMGAGGLVSLPPETGVQPGERLITVRGSGLALGFLQRGPIYEEALKHPEIKTFTVAGMFMVRCLVDDNTLDAASFRAEHGVAFVIETLAGQVLFDTGQSGDVLVHNAAQMGLDPGQIDALAFSHAHYDHTGGLEAFLQYSRPGLPLYAHPDLFRERFAIKNNQPRNIGLCMAQTDLAQRTTLHLSVEPMQIMDHVRTTGEITGRPEFEGNSPHHFIRANDGWLPDPYRDDMALVLEAQSGLIVVCGCCHAGLLNTLAHVRHLFTREIVAVVGGAHLANMDADTLEHTIAVLRAESAGRLPDLYLNHCTGERALAVLAQAFGEKVKPCPAGTVLIFN